MCPWGSHLGNPTPVGFLNSTSKWFCWVSRDFMLSHQINLLCSIPTIRAAFSKSSAFPIQHTFKYATIFTLSNITFCMPYRTPAATWAVNACQTTGQQLSACFPESCFNSLLYSIQVQLLSGLKTDIFPRL